jgi:hypothetical protein
MSGPNGEDIGVGVEVHRAPANDPTAFVELLLVRDMSLPQPTFDEVESTHQKSPGRTREFIAGLKDPGEASFENSWVPNSATDQLLSDAFLVGEVTPWQFKFPINDTTLLVWSFFGWVKAYQPASPLGELKMSNTTLRLSGSTSITTEAIT